MRRFPLLALVSFFAALVLRYPLPVNAQCGGTERWPVKVGTDSGANRVDLSNPKSISIDSLIHISEPQRPNDDVTRLDEETHVYAVIGRLVKFRLESGRTGDRDYHLVVTDDSLSYDPPGHSFVAEIPDPNCVAGKQGAPGTQSQFQSTLAAVRTKFEQHFTHITGGWNDAGGTEVRLLGIGFFDQPHGQTGHALNNIELHPILAICFEGETCNFEAAPPGGGAGPAPTPFPANLIQNSGFEEGQSAWKASQDVITSSPEESARSGSWKAWLGGYGSSHTDSLYQEVSIPANATSAILSFYLHVSTEEDNDKQTAYDTLKFQIRDGSGNLIKTLATFSNLNSAPGFALKRFDLTGYRGKTIRLYFVAKEDGRSMTSFVLDDFMLRLQ